MKLQNILAGLVAALFISSGLKAYRVIVKNERNTDLQITLHHKIEGFEGGELCPKDTSFKLAAGKEKTLSPVCVVATFDALDKNNKGIKDARANMPGESKRSSLNEDEFVVTKIDDDYKLNHSSSYN